MIVQKTPNGFPLTKSFISVTALMDEFVKGEDGKTLQINKQCKTEIATDVVFGYVEVEGGTLLLDKDLNVKLKVKESKDEIAQSILDSIAEQERIDAENREIQAEERKKEHLKYIKQIEEESSDTAS